MNEKLKKEEQVIIATWKWLDSVWSSKSGFFFVKKKYRLGKIISLELCELWSVWKWHSDWLGQHSPTFFPFSNSKLCTGVLCESFFFFWENPPRSKIWKYSIYTTMSRALRWMNEIYTHSEEAAAAAKNKIIIGGAKSHPFTEEEKEKSLHHYHHSI